MTSLGILPVRLGLALSVLLVAATASLADVPVRGRSLSLRASAADTTRRVARFVLADEAIAAPFPDPRQGARLILSGGIRNGQCRVDVELDPSKWKPLSADGETGGYRYLDPAGGVAGIRRIVLAPGKISMRAGIREWPCALAAAAERLPVSIELHAGAERYCSAFGGVIKRNERRRFFAAAAPAPESCGKTDITAANLNVLHGVDCDQVVTRRCRLNDRSILLFDWVDAIGCPDVLTFQEIFQPWAILIAGYQETACPFIYQRVYQPTGMDDDQMILSRFPVAEQEVVLLYRDLRSVTFARIDHPSGPLDVFTTHLASSSDGGNDACAGDCPPACVAAGALTARDCQAVQVAQYVEARHDIDAPAIVSGDFNAPPGSFIYRQFVDRGWTDVYLAAGNPECDAQTGVGCTSGRDDESLTDLEAADSKASARTDFIFALPPSSAVACVPAIEPVGDADGDLTSTALFADVPNPFSEACGPMPLPMCFPSDHVGGQLDWNCAAGLP